MSRIRCVYEGEFFPPDDFEETAEHGLVHARNLRPGTPRHTRNGLPTEADDVDASPRTRTWIGPGPMSSS